jgi:queuine/archaeosine tRNA-ribosyltransferase
MADMINYLLTQQTDTAVMAFGGVMAPDDERAIAETAKVVKDRVHDLEPSHIITVARPDGASVLSATVAEWVKMR